MRADRWRQSVANLDQDSAAARDPWTDLSFYFLFHAVLERVYLRAHIPFLDTEQDCAGRHRQRIRRWRHLSLGLVDGRRVGRVAAAGDLVCLLRRALCVGDDWRREG